jgi:hypothetical protein
MFVAAANAGIGGVISWDYGTHYWPDPEDLMVSGGNCLWMVPNSRANIEDVASEFYLRSLLQNYIPAHSDVLMTKWTGEDMRAASFKRPDGNYTFIVEANEAAANRSLSLNFSKALGKTVYKFAYTKAQVTNGNATAPACVKSFAGTGSKLTDTIGKEYTTIIYTTAPPKKQVELNAVTFGASAGASVQFDARLVDCANEQIGWEITAATNAAAKGGIDQNGRYTASASARAGDKIAVCAYLKSNPSVYAAGAVYIQ